MARAGRFPAGLALVAVAAVGCGASERHPDGAEAGSGGVSASGGTAAGGSGDVAGQAPAAGTATGGGAGLGESGGTAGSGATGGKKTAQGTGGGNVGRPSEGSGGTNAVAPLPNISGRWAMFDFEDRVVADITQTGSALSGRGSCTPDDAMSLCSGPLAGTVDDRRADFGFPIELVGTYEASVAIASDATRMAGSFGSLPYPESSMAWVRIPDGAVWLASDDTELEDAVRERSHRYDLEVTRAGGDVFVEGNVYLVQLRVSSWAALNGALGAFWAGEMKWHADEQTLEVGPVPATAPELPVALSLHFDGLTLSTVDATLSNGDAYAFSATVRLE